MLVCGHIITTMSHQAISKDDQPVGVDITDVPDECPICHNKGTFKALSLFHNSVKMSSNRELEVVFRCANSKCHDIFIGYYISDGRGRFTLNKTAPKEYLAREFSQIIKDLSENFVGIYNQAYKAESFGLDKVCGVGYRKALEFLIKDYLISFTEEDSEKQKIKEEFLGASIANRVDNTKIKEIAKRAAWLGNDETHYTKKWEEKDLND